MTVLELRHKNVEGQYQTVDNTLLVSGDSPRQLSLADGAALLEARMLPGLCTQRFSAELITEGLDYKTLSSCSRLTIGETELEISAAGKRCFDECVIHQAGEVCPLPSHCAFARVVQGGQIRAGMIIEHLN